MKKQFTFLKAGLMGLFLITSFSLKAQLINADNPVPNVSDGVNTVFAFGGSGFKLTATKTSTATGGAAGETFTDFNWSIKNSSGGGDDIISLTTAKALKGTDADFNILTVTDLAPGYYTFIAQGITDAQICNAPEEEFTVFVLAPLTVSVTLGGDNKTTYCSDDLASNSLTATAAYDLDTAFNTVTNLTAPTLDAFELRYRYYKVADGATFDISAATPIATQTPTANTTSDTYNFADANDAATGSFNYYVAVDYTVKASGPYVNALGGSTPTVIKVTPKPGKPTITISAN